MVGSVRFSSLCLFEMADRYACMVELLRPCCCRCAANMETVLEVAGSLNGVCII